MMTREAKTGLLLGLVFIVAIAIVLRGVHDQTSTTSGLEETLALQDSPPYEPGQLSVVVEHLDVSPATPLRNDSSHITPADFMTSVRLPQSDTHATPDIPDNSTGPSVEASRNFVANGASGPPFEESAIRYEQELPRQADWMSDSESFEPVSLTRQISRDAASMIDKALQTVRSGDRKVADNAVVIPPRPAAANAAMRKYVVEEGDDLSKIALKIYGPSEGNRWVNIHRLYQTNTKTLKSMDVVLPGQTLLIPALPGDRPSGTVQPAVSSQTSAARPAEKKPSAKDRIYVVQEGDSFWSIAQDQLGKGMRYQDLLALNRMSEDRVLQPGVRLRLPSQ